MSEQKFVHLLVYDPDGPIRTSGSMKLRVACSPKSSMPFAASHQALKSVISCPLCLKTPEFEELCSDGNSDADAAANEYVKAKG